MATEIKAIKCPQCGSTENTELEQNRFKCNKCGTEYFLDNDSAAEQDNTKGNGGLIGLITSVLSGLNKNGNVKINVETPTVTVVNGVALNKTEFQRDLATGQITQELADIRENGIPTKGVILSSKPTGNIVNGEGEIALQVKVTRPNGTAYEVAVTKHVPQSGMAFTVPGSVVHIFYKPGDEQNIMIGFFA
jgi:ribosomal protein S27AE